MVFRTKKESRLALYGGISAVFMMAAPSVAAEVSQSEIDVLKAQIAALEKRLNSVQAVQETKLEEVKSKQDAVEIKLENGKPLIKTSDGNFEMALRGRMHFDMATYDQDGNNLPAIAPGRDLSEGGNIRRGEFGIEGKFMRDWEYHSTFNFGGSGVEAGGVIKNMYLGYTGFKPLSIQIGAIKVPMTLDETTSANEIMFIERSSAAAMAVSYGGGNSRTAVGMRGNANNFFASAYYTGGVVGEGGVDEASNVVGRAAYMIAPNADTQIHLGASATRVFEFSQASSAIPPALQGASTAQFNLQDRPELRVDGTRLVSTGLLNVEDGSVAGPEFAAAWKNFFIQSEYYYYELDPAKANVAGAANLSSFDFDGWYVQGSWVLTGEAKKYDSKGAWFHAPKSANPLGFGGFGAVEFAARYSTVDLNDGANAAICTGNAAQTAPAPTSSCVRGGEQDIVTLGLNWYPNSNIRFMLNYLFVDVDRRAYSNNTVANGGPNAQIGQDYDAIALRSQFNF